MLKCFVIQNNQRAALLCDGEFEAILNSGHHYMYDPHDQLSIEAWQIDAAKQKITVPLKTERSNQQPHEAAV